MPDNDKPEPIHIVKVVGENIKAVKAVTLVLGPEGELTTISGKNGHGKSSSIALILLALDGAKVLKKFPLRDDAENGFAETHLTTGHVVRRTFPGPGKPSRLSIVDGDGEKVPGGPAKFLSGLTGDLSFDPIEFERLSRSEQRAKLIEVSDIDIDLVDHNARHKTLYAERTVAHQDALRLEGHLKELGETDPLTPSKLVDEKDLRAKFSKAVKRRSAAEEVDAQLAAAVEATSRALDGVASAARQAKEALARVRRENQALVAAAEVALADADVMASAAAARAAKRDEVLKDGLPSVEQLEIQMANTVLVNAAVRARWDREEAKADAEGAREAWEALDANMKALEEEKAVALRGAKFPLEGLGFTDEDLTYNGHAFETLATSEQIRVATSIAMALNPRICLVIIHHGNDLDSASWAVVGEMARKHRFQIVGEFVDETGELGIVIEDGCVVTA